MKRDGMVLRKDTWHYYLDGAEVTQAEYERRYPPPAAEDGPCSLSAVKPMHSEALAVSPRRVKQAEADAKRHGVPTEFDQHGRPVFTSRDHQRRYCQIYGYVNKDDNWSAKNYGVRPKAPEELAKEIFDG